MNHILELTSGFLTADPAVLGFKDLTPSTPNGFLVRNYPHFDPLKNKNEARLIQVWSETQLPSDFQRITSANLHDVNVALTFPVDNTSELIPLLQWNDIAEVMQPNDKLTVQATNASGFAGVQLNTHMLMFYPYYPDVVTSFISYSELKRRFRHYLLNKVRVTPDPALVGQFSGAVALNKTSDPFVMTDEYAILGANVVGTTYGCIRFRGSDWGNYGIGLPGQSQSFYGLQYGLNWFCWLSRLYNDMPLIPVMKGLNRSTTVLDVTANNLVAADVIVQYAQLNKP